MADRTTAQVLDAPMGLNDAGATTVRAFLVALLRTLWEDGEDFSAKRPWGTSGWQYAVHDAALGPDASSVDTDPLILAAIDSLGATQKRTVPLVDDVLDMLPHLTGDELRRVAEAMPRVAGEWEHRWECWRRFRREMGGAGLVELALVRRHSDGERWVGQTEGPHCYTTHPTARAAQAACDARLEAAGVRLCGEVVR